MSNEIELKTDIGQYKMCTIHSENGWQNCYTDQEFVIAVQKIGQGYNCQSRVGAPILTNINRVLKQIYEFIGAGPDTPVTLEFIYTVISDFDFDITIDNRVLISKDFMVITISDEYRCMLKFQQCCFDNCDFSEKFQTLCYMPTWNNYFINCTDIKANCQACPTEGSFIAWKMCGERLVKLLIPEDAKRISGNSCKCRADKAYVLAIYNIRLLLNEIYDKVEVDECQNQTHLSHRVKYKVGEWVYPDKYDEDPTKICTSGIHFYVDRNYTLTKMYLTPEVGRRAASKLDWYLSKYKK